MAVDPAPAVEFRPVARLGEAIRRRRRLRSARGGGTFSVPKSSVSGWTVIKAGLAGAAGGGAGAGVGVGCGVGCGAGCAAGIVAAGFGLPSGAHGLLNLSGRSRRKRNITSRALAFCAADCLKPFLTPGLPIDFGDEQRNRSNAARPRSSFRVHLARAKRACQHFSSPASGASLISPGNLFTGTVQTCSPLF